MPPRWCGYDILPSNDDDEGVRPPADEDLCDGEEAEFVACMNCSMRDERDIDIGPRSSTPPSVGMIAGGTKRSLVSVRAREKRKNTDEML
jgi:hypothetical protein